jgi:pyruvate/2-oxoglutarate dehydrogenase complex dihydrolipoamide dehydrogenase (E3) component
VEPAFYTPEPASRTGGIYAIPEISMVGEAEHALTAQRVPYETGVARYREFARGQILGVRPKAVAVVRVCRPVHGAPPSQESDESN